MSLAQHLVELRKRIVRSAMAILVGTVIGWFFTDLVWAALEQPVQEIAEAFDRDAKIIFPTITSAFDLRLQLAFYLGLLLSSPIWLYQLFAYIVPGLTRRERRYAFAFVGVSVPLFTAGAVLGWWVLPNMVRVMTSFVPEGSSSYLDATFYFQFVLKLMLAMAFSFVVPVLLVVLNFAGVISAASIIRSWRVAVVVILIFTGIATPSADIVSMVLLAVPMMVLYMVAAFIAWIHDRRAAKRQAALLEAESV